MKFEKDLTSNEILEHWQQGKSLFDWRGLGTKGKSEWLKACVSWSGLSNKPLLPFNYIIDGSQINSRLDYYCLLGETFFGYRGYFGRDLDGWYDCFCEEGFHVIKSSEDSFLKVTIRNANHVREALGDEYFLSVVNGFKDRGFEVELD